MKNRVLFIGGNFSPEPTGIGKYNGEMISWLARRGFDCTVITTYEYYPHWKVQESKFKYKFWYRKEITDSFSESGGRITTYRCPQYVPSKPSGIKRVALDISFLLSAGLIFLLTLLRKRFDYVICVVPSFHVGIFGVLYKKLRKAKFIYHIQDMQIEVARDLNLFRSKTLLNTMFTVEKYILKRANVVCTISGGMGKKIHEKTKRPVYLLPNWTDTMTFYPVKRSVNYRKTLGFKATDKIILYSGAIGEKQGIDSILVAAKNLQHIKDFKFVICSSGPYKEKLQYAAAMAGIKNVSFMPLRPLDDFNKFLNMADLHLVIQKSCANDLVMPSKLTNIFAVGGVALITASKDSDLYQVVERNNIGMVIEPDSQDALTNGIQYAFSIPREEISRNARKYAEEVLDIEPIMQTFVNNLAKV